jgi:hypothetical protein
MRTDPNDQPLQSESSSVDMNEVNASRETIRSRGNDTEPRSTAATDIQHETGIEEIKRRPHRAWLPRRSSSERVVRRLGAPEYTLIALIAFGIAITIVMAILDPSG